MSKRSYGSCRAEYVRRDEEQQYINIPANEAARLAIALENVVATIISNERRTGESDVRLWIHSPEGKPATITVYNLGDD